MKIKLILLFLSFSLFTFAQEGIPIKGDELFGSMRARHIGPALMSGRIGDIVGHPTDNKILFAGASGGGVWKSADGGVTFRPIFEKHCQSIGAIAIDPKKPDNVMWVGTGEIWTRNSVTGGDGIYKSTDGGQNWLNVGLPNSERISSIQINPNNTDEVFVGVLGALWGDSEDRGIYKTSDGGKTWSKIFSVNATTGCSDIVMDPNDAKTMYASFWEFRRTAFSFNSGGENSALYKSTDGGKSWNKIHNGFPTGKLGRIAIALAPSKTSTLYCVLETEQEKDKGLYKSEDSGATWKQMNNDFGIVVRPFYFSRITVDPKNPDIILKAGLRGSISKDGGKTFRDIGGGIHADVHDFWFDLHDSNRMYLCDDGGFYRSYDGGSVWEQSKSLPVSQYYHVSTDNQTPYRVYGGLQDNGSWIGPSAKYGGIENRDWVSVGAGDGFRVYPHPEDPNIVYSEMQGAENIWRINVAKNQAKIIKPFPTSTDPKFRFNWNAPILTSNHKPNRLFVGSQFLHMSDDQGETWNKISGDLTTNDPAKQQQENSGGLSMDNSGAENHCTVFAIAESPLDEKVIWVGTDDGNVQLTQDGGKTWTNLTANLVDVPKNTWAYYIEASNFDKNTAYVVFDGHTQNDGKTYALKTSDAGKTWKSIVTGEIKTFARCIKEDNKNPDLLFLGTEGGLYVTVDGGINWSQFTNNMPPVAVHWIAHQKRDDAIVMATHGRGVIIIDDISPLRQITKESANEELKFLIMKPSKKNETNGFGGYARMGEFVGENPNSQARIGYFMKSRHTFGKMTMEIFDASGKKIADLPPGKSKGINFVDWNYSLKPPKVAKGKTLVFGGFAGPTVPAGKYKVLITKGKNEFTTDLVLENDANSSYSDADRKLQFETAMKIFNMTEQLAYTVEQIDLINTFAETATPKITSKKLKKQMPISEMQTELTKLKETLVVLTGDNYVGSAEPQLREKISGVYGEVIAYAGKPTNAQLSNITVLNDKLLAAQKTVTDAKTKIVLWAESLSKLGIESPKFKTFEEFVAE